MTIRSALMASVFGAGVLFAASQASAVQIIGSSSSTFSNLDNCSGGDCGIFNSSKQLRWGSTSSRSNLVNPSTLTINDQTWNQSTNINDLVLTQLTWFNNATLSSQTDSNFDVDWNVTFTFTSPNAPDPFAIETFSLNILSPTNSTGDSIVGLTLASLNGLEFSLNGVTISDLKYKIIDQGGDSHAAGCDGSNGDTALNGSTWFNCEGNTALLQITADFTANQVPEPATLALLGMGLVGLGAIRRRKAA